MSDSSVLHVLFDSNSWHGNEGDVVLSFLAPAAEQDLPAPPLCARTVVNSIRDEALSTYFNLVAAVGATRCEGKTLRQELAVDGQGNPWWYHRFSEKNVESDPTFDRILKITAIMQVARENEISRIMLYGGEIELAQTLASSGILVEQSRGRGSFYREMIRAIGSRVKYIMTAIVELMAIRRYTILPDIRPDIVLQGFWDWSIKLVDGKVRDLYFGDLPAELNKRGVRHAWFLWYSHLEFKSFRKRLSLGLHRDILSPTNQDKNMIITQRFLSVADIIKAVLDLRPAWRFAWFSRRREFRQIFFLNGVDFWPLVREVLWANFINSCLPHHLLVEIASRRAAQHYQPKASLNFLELFLHSRAFYQGTVNLNHPMRRYAVQHASYNREKTFLRLDPQRETQGAPDGLASPLPDGFFCMGTLGREILLENGLPPEQIMLSGSPRYDKLNFNWKTRGRGKDSELSVLIVSTLHENLDLEMIQAVVLATAKLKNVKLFLRSHPFNRLEQKENFKPYINLITPLSGSLTDNLQQADLVIFSYSTVAEESFIRGVPIIQWLSARFNGSVFRDIKLSKVKTVCTVGELSGAIEEFSRSPQAMVPTISESECVVERCFYKTDGQAAVRIAEYLIGKI